MPVTWTDNSQKCRDAIINAVLGAMDAVGARASEIAREIVPVDTGALRDSIEHETTSDGTVVSTVISANTDYAAYVELGTSRQRAQPYLRPAVVDHASEYKDQVSSVVSDAIK